MITASADGRTDREVWMRSPETGRKRKYRIDHVLDPVVIDAINVLAFAQGLEVCYTCAGHGELEPWQRGDPAFALADYRNEQDHRFAQVRFAIKFPSECRLEARGADILARRLAAYLCGRRTHVRVRVYDDADETDVVRSGPPMRWVIVTARHTRETLSDPEGSARWWRDIACRLERI